MDPHRGLRDALAGRLSPGRYDVVSTVDSGEYGLEAVSHLKPDIVMLEVWLPGASGIEIAAQMNALEDKPRVLFYTGDSDPAVLHAALVAGAVGFALKAGTLDEVRWAVEQVANGRTYIDPRLEGALRAPRVAGCGPLTEREGDVLTLAAQGLTTGDIAEQLGLGVETVRTYVDRAVRKLRARNRTHAVTIALEAGLIALALPPGIEARLAARAAVAAAGGRRGGGRRASRRLTSSSRPGAGEGRPGTRLLGEGHVAVLARRGPRRCGNARRRARERLPVRFAVRARVVGAVGGGARLGPGRRGSRRRASLINRDGARPGSWGRRLPELASLAGRRDRVALKRLLGWGRGRRRARRGPPAGRAWQDPRARRPARLALVVDLSGRRAYDPALLLSDVTRSGAHPSPSRLDPRRITTVSRIASNHS